MHHAITVLDVISLLVLLFVYFATREVWITYSVRRDLERWRKRIEEKRKEKKP